MGAGYNFSLRRGRCQPFSKASRPGGVGLASPPGLGTLSQRLIIAGTNSWPSPQNVYHHDVSGFVEEQ